MKVLFDTNVVLDVLLAREPFAHTAARLLSIVDSGRVEGVVCATTVTTIHYIASKAVGRDRAHKHVDALMSIFDVAPVDRQVLVDAMRPGFADFEDAVLHQAAVASGADAIVTRNGQDFAGATLPVFDPPALLAAILVENQRSTD